MKPGGGQEGKKGNEKGVTHPGRKIVARGKERVSARLVEGEKGRNCKETASANRWKGGDAKVPKRGGEKKKMGREQLNRQTTLGPKQMYAVRHKKNFGGGGDLEGMNRPSSLNKEGKGEALFETQSGSGRVQAKKRTYAQGRGGRLSKQAGRMGGK